MLHARAQILEVAEVEVTERFQSAVESVVQLNKTAAERDLDEIMRRADVDGNRELDFAELFELLVGQKIDPLVEPLAREMIVLKSPEKAESAWEQWGSLLIASPIRAVSRASAVARRTLERLGDKAGREGEELLVKVASEAIEGRQWEVEIGRNMSKSFTDDAWLEAISQLGDQITDPRSSKARALERAERAAEAEAAEAEAATAGAGAARPTRGRWRKPWRWRRRRAV